MTLEEIRIYKQLKSAPEFMYITREGDAIYALTDDGMIRMSSLATLSSFTDAEINEAISATLS